MKRLFGFGPRHAHITPDAVLAALATVLEPEVNRDLVSLGMVKNVAARDGVVSFSITLREAGSPLQVPIERRARKAVLAVDGVKEVHITFETAERPTLRDTTQLKELDVKRIVAVASGKGGVGKSTIAVNLAVALAQAGHRTGILDGDIHGPNVPMMLGIQHEQPFSFGDKIFPPQAHGVTAMSMGLLVPAESPVIWRGPMLHQAIRQMLRDVMWGQLDYLIVDLPPGTGDVQLTLIQSLPLTGAVIVTTPQPVAVADATKGAHMFRQLDVPILGLIENMSYYNLPDGTRDHVFGEGGGAALAQQLKIPLLAQVPLNSAVRQCADEGAPIIITDSTSVAANALKQAAAEIHTRASALPLASSVHTHEVDPILKIIQ